jgi:hypothetical protein
MRTTLKSFVLMESFVGRRTEASSIIRDAPGTFEGSGNCRKWSHPRTDLRRLAELYHPKHIAEELSIWQEMPIDRVFFEPCGTCKAFRTAKGSIFRPSGNSDVESIASEKPPSENRAYQAQSAFTVTAEVPCDAEAGARSRSIAEAKVCE